MRCLFVLLIFAVVAGCAHRREVKAYKLHGEACESLGYSPGSNPWADCTNQLERARVTRIQSVVMKTANDPQKTMTCEVGRKTVCQ